MTLAQILFLVFAAAVLGCALLVVLGRNIFHCAIAMATSFLGIACIYLLMSADFVGLSQIIVYVGAISILMLFAIMLTEDVVGARSKALRRVWPAALPVAAAILALLLKWVAPEFTRSAALVVPEGGTALFIGRAFLNQYIFAFELTAVILVAAVIGAIYLAREERS